MSQKTREQQFIIREWMESTGNTEIDMHEVATYAHEVRGWPLPPPISGIDRLAKEFSQAAREETRQDEQTGRPYRVYHAFMPDGGGQGVFRWMDIDVAPRTIMQKSAVMRREQVIGDMVQLKLDLDHWNRVNSDEAPIVLITDVTEDVNERLSGPDEAAA
jgi:hypothetical protein